VPAPDAAASPALAAPGEGEKKPDEQPAPPRPAEKPAPPPPAEKPAPPKPPAKPEEPPKGTVGPTCRLPSEEGPRGGRLVIEGEGFGRTPVVRIGDRVTRILVRQAKTISVQIPADSDGGPVTVEAEGVRAACGWLTIVGKDR